MSTVDGNQGIARWLSATTAEQHAVTRAHVEARQLPPPPARSLPPVEAAVEVPVRVPVIASAFGSSSPTGWQGLGNCRGIDPGLFFPAKTEPEQLALARAVCDGCVVRVQCLAWALEQPEEFGVWGGTSERQRRRLRKGLPRWARCSRCGGRFVKVHARQRFCVGSCEGGAGSVGVAS